MTTGRILKYFVLIFIIAFFLIALDRIIFMLFGKEFPEPAFTVHGDSNTINNMVINIESFDLAGGPYTCSKVQSLLFKQQRYSFENPSVTIYKIYFSYGNQVGTLEFANLYSRGNGGVLRVNSIYVIKKDNQVYLEYYPVTEDRKGHKVSHLSMAVNDYFAENNIPAEEQQSYMKKFYTFYDPEQQQYQRDPLKKEFISEYEKKTLEHKMFYHVDIADIQKMDIPEVEKQALIKHAEKEPFTIECNNRKINNYTFFN